MNLIWSLLRLSLIASGVSLADDLLVIVNFNAPILPLGAGMQFVFKPLRWLGVFVAGGYRYVAKINFNLNFNGAYYSYGAWIDIRQIYRDIKYYGFQKR